MLTKHHFNKHTHLPEALLEQRLCIPVDDQATREAIELQVLMGEQMMIDGVNPVDAMADSGLFARTMWWVLSAVLADTVYDNLVHRYATSKQVVAL